MRRPQFSSIFARGFLAIRKSLSLATKGILDQKIGGKSFLAGFFEKIFIIKGIKSFEFKFICEIIGKRQREVVTTIDLVGKKQTLIEANYLINALLEKQLELALKLKGSKIFELKDSLILQGIKRIGILDNLNLLGKKQFNLDWEKLILAKREIPITKETNLIGSKKMDMNEQILIKGKRDITPILMALDLIGGK